LQPVVGIGWHEARAYCAWLSVQTGQSYRLPSEVEWEAAASGNEARRYAWGKQFDTSHCNTFESHVRGSTPVGVFPEGETPEGLAEMTGSVWEWTSSLYRPYHYRADDGREDAENAGDPRVLRGGSWSSLRVSCRCAYRYGDSPVNRPAISVFGFVVRPPSNEALHAAPLITVFAVALAL
jgi:formylglycine-generating enzyme required for sulfatase activity